MSTGEDGTCIGTRYSYYNVLKKCAVWWHIHVYLGEGKTQLWLTKSFPLLDGATEEKKHTSVFQIQRMGNRCCNRNSGVSLKLHYNEIRLEHVTHPPRSTVCSKTHETSAFEWDCLLLPLTH